MRLLFSSCVSFRASLSCLISSLIYSLDRSTFSSNIGSGFLELTEYVLVRY